MRRRMGTLPLDEFSAYVGRVGAGLVEEAMLVIGGDGESEMAFGPRGATVADRMCAASLGIVTRVFLATFRAGWPLRRVAHRP